jgi:hypothetical protein
MKTKILVLALAGLALCQLAIGQTSNVNINDPKVKVNSDGTHALPVRLVDTAGAYVDATGGGGGGGGAVTIADGADVVEGTLADSVSSAGGTGSISAKLRRLTTDIDAIKTNTAVLKQYAGVPSTFTISTTDNTTVFTLAAGEVGFIQNLDAADALGVKFGASPTTSSLSFILPCGVAADDGRGGQVRIDNWTGAVSVISMTGSPRYIAWKIAP